MGAVMPANHAPPMSRNVSPDTPLFVLQGHNKPIVRVRFLDDRTIVSVGFNSEVRDWSADGHLLRSTGQRLSHRADACAISGSSSSAITK